MPSKLSPTSTPPSSLPSPPLYDWSGDDKLLVWFSNVPRHVYLQCDRNFATLAKSSKSWAIFQGFIYYLPLFWTYFGKFCILLDNFSLMFMAKLLMNKPVTLFAFFFFLSINSLIRAAADNNDDDANETPTLDFSHSNLSFRRWQRPLRPRPTCGRIIQLRIRTNGTHLKCEILFNYNFEGLFSFWNWFEAWPDLAKF